MESGTPCGCEKIQDSESEPDPQKRELQERLGKQFAAEWQCPRFCGARTEPHDVSPGPAETLVAVERLTGVGGLKTCPRWYTQQQAIATACAARQWAERGLLRERYGEPSLALMQAVEVLDGAIAAKDRAERKERERKAKLPNGGHN